MSKELIRLRNICMAFDDEQVLDNINLYFNDSEFLTLLGPSGCGKTAVTDYRTLETRGELSLVEVGLETGRTHQIRASFADLGCPLLGDGKYGRGDVNRRYGETRQALYAYELTFDLPTDAGLLNYLRGRTFTVENVPFRAKYFG